MANIASFVSLLQAQVAPGAEKAAAAPGNPTLQLILQLAPFLALFVVFYFLILRPQGKKQKETKKMLASLKKGDKVVTIGGLHGQVSSVKETTVILKVDDACKLEFLRSAIASVISREDSEPADKSMPEVEKK